MSETKDFELPKPSEKLSHKFILDSLNEIHKHEASPTLEESKPQCGTQAELPIKPQCGTQAELPIDIEQEPHESVPMEELKLEDGKNYFRIGEVSNLIGVEPYVLRYWESEFSVIRPTKASSGHRVYSKKDVEALHVIRHLLHVEKYSIKGAKKRFLERKKQVKEDHGISKSQLRAITHEIKELINLIKNL